MFFFKSCRVGGRSELIGKRSFHAVDQCGRTHVIVTVSPDTSLTHLFNSCHGQLCKPTFADTDELWIELRFLKPSKLGLIYTSRQRWRQVYLQLTRHRAVAFTAKNLSDVRQLIRVRRIEGSSRNRQREREREQGRT